MFKCSTFTVVHGCHPDHQLRLSSNNEISSATQSLQEESNRFNPHILAGVLGAVTAVIVFAVVGIFCCIGHIEFHLSKKKQPPTDPRMIPISSKETFSPFLMTETPDVMQLCSLLEMVNECPKFLKNIESIRSTCNRVENDDITYMLMHTNFDQAVLRETLLLNPRIKRNDTVKIGMHLNTYVSNIIITELRKVKNVYIDRDEC